MAITSSYMLPAPVLPPGPERNAHLESYFDRYWEGLVAYTKSVGQNLFCDNVSADDIVCEARFRLMRTRSLLRGHDGWLLAYVRTTIQRLLADRYRQNERRITCLELDALNKKHLKDVGQPVYSSRSKLQDVVREAVGNLRPDYKKIVKLFYFEEISCEEIANIVGLDSTAVRGKLHRARRQLSKLLET